MVHSSGTNIVTYKDQTVLFYNSPLNYLKTNFPDTVDETFPPSLFPSTKPGTAPPADGKWDHQWPSHLIFFGALLSDIQGGPKVEAYIRELGYGEVRDASNESNSPLDSLSSFPGRSGDCRFLFDWPTLEAGFVGVGVRASSFVSLPFSLLEPCFVNIASMPSFLLLIDSMNMGLSVPTFPTSLGTG